MDVAILLLLAAQLPVAVALGLRGGVGPWFLVPALWAAMPVDALLAVHALVNLFGRRKGRVERRLYAAVLFLSVVDVVAIAWLFRDSHW